ncbi:MAG TPA: hypothetical protein VFV08_15195 [Puia sp.]|nr:hypothetical protein [Puia sp.]
MAALQRQMDVRAWESLCAQDPMYLDWESALDQLVQNVCSLGAEIGRAEPSMRQVAEIIRNCARTVNMMRIHCMGTLERDSRAMTPRTGHRLHQMREERKATRFGSQEYVAALMEFEMPELSEEIEEEFISCMRQHSAVERIAFNLWDRPVELGPVVGREYFFDVAQDPGALMNVLPADWQMFIDMIKLYMMDIEVPWRWPDGFYQHVNRVYERITCMVERRQQQEVGLPYEKVYVRLREYLDDRAVVGLTRILTRETRGHVFEPEQWENILDEHEKELRRRQLEGKVNKEIKMEPEEEMKRSTANLEIEKTSTANEQVDKTSTANAYVDKTSTANDLVDKTSTATSTELSTNSRIQEEGSRVTHDGSPTGRAEARQEFGRGRADHGHLENVHNGAGRLCDVAGKLHTREVERSQGTSRPRITQIYQEAPDKNKVVHGNMTLNENVDEQARNTDVHVQKVESAPRSADFGIRQCMSRASLETSPPSNLFYYLGSY